MSKHRLRAMDDPMRYIEEVLQPGEVVLFDGTVHWLIYVPGAILLVIGLALVPAGWLGQPSTTVFILFISPVLILLGLWSLAQAWFKRWTTEIAVTDHRIVYKHGFIRRRTIEMNMEKVESVDVSQSIPGRIFNYGDVLIRGVGVGFSPLKMIDDPIKLRNTIIAK